MSSRLEILNRSLAKKNAEFGRRLSDRNADIQSANGQPLNDKRNGSATLSRWDRHDDALRTLRASIETTERAVERERNLIAHVDAVAIPDFLADAVAAGELTQWRKHPNRFFVVGVERGRIVWDAKSGRVMFSHVSEIPAEQYGKFWDVANRILAATLIGHRNALATGGDA